jgi:hypothetical protein
MIFPFNNFRPIRIKLQQTQYYFYSTQQLSLNQIRRKMSFENSEPASVDIDPIVLSSTSTSKSAPRVGKDWYTEIL